MKRKMITMLLAMGLVLSQATNFAFAETHPYMPESDILSPIEMSSLPGDASVQSIRTYSITFSKESNTKGSGKITVLSSTTPSSIKVTIQLQVADKNSTSYKKASADPVTATIKNKFSLSKSFSFPITTAKKYRVKATVVETVNGQKNTYTYYKALS